MLTPVCIRVITVLRFAEIDSSGSRNCKGQMAFKVQEFIFGLLKLEAFSRKHLFQIICS